MIVLVPWLLAQAAPAPSASPAEVALIWNGLDLSWGYNHRINRMGSLVLPTRCDAAGCASQVLVTGATGSGSDAAAWRVPVVAVRAPGVRFVQGQTSCRVEDRRGEGQVLPDLRHVEVPGPAGQTALVALGGFDLRATRDPDRLQHLRLWVGDAVVSPDHARVGFDVGVGLQLDCDSPECDPLDRAVSYDVTVAWTVITAEGDLDVTPLQVDRASAWRRHGPELSPEPLQAPLPHAEGAPGAAFLVMQDLSVTLNRDHHLQQWTSTVETGVSEGAPVGRYGLLFKQWNAETRRRLLSYTSHGTAAWSMRLAYLQLPGGEATPQELSGTLSWEANGRAPDPARSQVLTTVALP